LEQLKTEVEALAVEAGRHLVLIPESDLNDPRLLWARERGGFQLDAQWSDDFHHALHTVLTGERTGYYSDFGNISQIADALKNAYVYDGKFSPHRRRLHGRSAAGLSGHQFLGYLQNHDQTGNRALGERSARLMSLGKLKTGAALVLTSPFVPMLFQGEEWGASTPFYYFTDYQDPELAKAVREGRCREFAAFGWKPEDTVDPQAPETFERSKLNWTEIKRAPHAEILDWHKNLIRLRRDEPDLSDGRMDRLRARFDETNKWLAIERGALSIVCNFAGETRNISLAEGKNHIVLLASESGIVPDKNSIKLPPDYVAILKTS
jgi:maltooligosyltrehalose trehalohydrolase